MRSFDYAKVSDPLFFSDGRLEPHSDHPYYPSASCGKTGQNDFIQSLNGLWKFHYAKNYANTIADFQSAEYNCKNWDDIYVPAHIQMEGYDTPQYANTQYPWEGHEDIRPGQIPSRFNPVASYVKYFSVAEHMKDRRLFISFQGAESGLAVWLNGHYIGYSGDSFTPSEFELTEYICDGENKLAVQVFKWTSGSWCEDQDFYRFSGLYRDVYLYTVPDVHIRDLCIRSTLDDTFTKGQIRIESDVWGSGTAKYRISYNGRLLVEEKEKISDRTTVCFQIDDPKLWSAETPCLYDLSIEVFDHEGREQEFISERIGFRRFEIRDGLMKLNGRRIVFKGVNRHEFSSVTGRVVSEEELRKDLVTMKQNNINAIRTCHYPDASAIYRLCDEYGIYMIDEMNMETHGSWDTLYTTGDYDYVLPHNKPEWLPMLLDRANSMYQRDKNHPAILIWSCGNESYGGKDIYEVSQFFRRSDPTRLVHYEGVFHDRSYNDTTDIESQMYPSVDSIKAFLAANPHRPLICCEYTHAMGNSCGAMHKYTDLTDTEPLYQGGFIWDYIDQTLHKKDRYGNDFQAYGGDFGERPTDYNFSANGIVYGDDRSPSPKMQEIKYNYQNITVEMDADTITIVNKNLFISTETYHCVLTVEKEGKLLRTDTLHTSVPPLSRETYSMPFSQETEPGEYVVTASFQLRRDEAWAKAGHEVAFGQHIYIVESSGNQKIHLPLCNSVGDTLQIVRSKHNIGVKGEHFQAIFSILDGGLVSYRYGGREMIESIPRPNFWRAPTDNDQGNHMPKRYAQWKIASLYAGHKYYQGDHYNQILEPHVRVSDDTVTVSYTYVMPTVPASECVLTYEVEKSGWIRTVLTYNPIRELGDMPEFGVLFKVDADYDHVHWYGLGPQETYKDRKHGAKMGVYHNRVADNMARYIVPQECGAKMDVRYASVTDRKGRGLLFEMDPLSGPMMFSALPYTPHELENAKHPYELPAVHYTVIRVAADQMGVGGDDSWGACTHPEYLLTTNNVMTFAFRFKGI